LTKVKEVPPIKRGRGRPPGSRNKPKNVVQWVQANIDDPLAAPPFPGRMNLSQLRGPEASAWGKFLYAKRTAMIAAGIPLKKAKDPGIPGLNHPVFKPLMIKADTEANRLYNIMDQNEMLPDDEIAKAAIFATLKVLHEPSSPAVTLQAANILLTYTKQKPASKSDVTVNAAEAFLTALSEADGN
jgi:hypothetical protein